MSEFDWKPFEGDVMKFEKVGDTITGRIVDIQTKTGKQGPVPVVVLQIDVEGNQREVWGSAADLKGQLAALRPQIGWWLAVEFSGERHTGQASPMKLFTIKCKEPAPNGVQAAREALAPTPEPIDPLLDAPFRTAGNADEFSEEPF